MRVECIVLGVLFSSVAVKGASKPDPDWWKNGVFYQIYPRSFKDSNNDGIGDLKGITSELQHLKDAGITGAWLSPIYKSPQVDQGYDISNYIEIDEVYGEMEDFDEMVTKAHELGIKIIMDFVPNHSSNEHEWFEKSVKGEDPYKDYYVWVDTKSDKTPPNNWLSVFHGPAWSYNEIRKQWYLHQFAPQQPDLNFRNTAVREAMKGVLEFWLKKNVDGFRLDAVPFLLEDKDLRNEEPSGDPNAKPGEHEFLNHTYTKDLQESYELIYELRQIIDNYNEENPNDTPRILMSEAYTSLSNTMLYYTDADRKKKGTHIPFNFMLVGTDKKTSAETIANLTNEWLSNMPQGDDYVANWVVGNHDNHRVASRVGPLRADGINMLIASLPGIMVTYNGEEIGLEDGYVPQQACKDPRGCKAEPKDYEREGRDCERTPFHWNGKINAGFNDGHTTWLPVSEKYKTNNLEAQKVESITTHYRVYQEVLKLRQNEVFKKGTVVVKAATPNVVSIIRSLNTETFITLVNVGPRQEVVENILTDKDYVEVVLANSDSKKLKGILSTKKLVLEPNESIICKPVDTKSVVYDWWKTGVFYQIYPRSFKDANNDGIGDLKGIISKLDHLKNLDITATWLSPIYTSPQVDQGYDISNFREIDEDYGTLEDFDKLVKEANQRGIRIIMDFVPNHSSDQHAWFKESVKSNPQYKDYYVWKDGKSDDIPPNSWNSIFKYSAWKWNEVREQYYLHQFAEQQPDLNYRSRALVEEMKDVLRFWLDRGVSGFRMDAVPYLIEDEKFEDEPRSNAVGFSEVEWKYYKHTYTSDTKMTFDIIYEFRKVLDDYSLKHGGDERVMMTEAYTDIYTTMYYYGNEEQNGAHFTFNFQLIDQVNEQSNAVFFAEAIIQWLKVMPTKYTANWVIGNHDNPRAATRFGVQNVDGINMLGAILPGVMVTYNGEEIGQENGEVTWEEGKDPSACNGDKVNFNKTSRDFERTPFHWDATTNAGFNTGGKPWLPVSQKYRTNNLQAQINVPNSHYEIYRKLIQLRKEPAFISGYTHVKAVTNEVLAVARELNETNTYVLLFNIGPNEETFDLRTLLPSLTKHLRVVVPSGNSKRQKDDLIETQNVILTSHESIIAITTSSDRSAATLMCAFNALLMIGTLIVINNLL